MSQSLRDEVARLPRWTMREADEMGPGIPFDVVRLQEVLFTIDHRHESGVVVTEASASGAIVLIDVDGTVSDGRMHSRAQVRPGALLVLDTLACLGYQIIAWSAGGERHARTVCEALNLHGPIWRYAAKPAYPMTEEAALAALGGFRPVLQIDDDHSERVGDWPFMEWPTFHFAARKAESGVVVTEAEYAELQRLRAAAVRRREQVHAGRDRWRAAHPEEHRKQARESMARTRARAAIAEQSDRVTE